MLNGNFLRADGLALVFVGAVAKTLFLHRFDHGDSALVTFGLTLGQDIEVFDLGADKKHCRGILARGNTRTAADTGRCIKGFGCQFLLD